MLVDFALITASFTIAYLLFVQGSGTDYEKHIFLVSLPAILVRALPLLHSCGLYSGVWRFAGAHEGLAIVVAVVVSEALAVGIVWFSSGPFGDFPARIYVVDALLAIVLIGASRFGERALFRAHSTFIDRRGRRRTLLVGAGRSGRSLLRELRETPGEHVVGFVDDDPRLSGRRMQGVPVLGGLDEIERVLVLTRAGARARHDPERAARTARRCRARMRGGGSTLQVRATGARPRPGRRPRSDGGVNGRSAAAAR